MQSLASACKPVSGAAGARRRVLGQGEKKHFGYAETMQGGLPGTAEILFPLRRTGDVATYDTPALVSRPKLRAIAPQKIAACFAEERSFGHDFLFVPVFIGCGAIFWFSLDTSPSFPVLAITCLIAAGLASFTKYRSGPGSDGLRLFRAVLAGHAFRRGRNAAGGNRGAGYTRHHHHYRHGDAPGGRCTRGLAICGAACRYGGAGIVTPAGKGLASLTRGR